MNTKYKPTIPQFLGVNKTLIIHSVVVISKLKINQTVDLQFRRYDVASRTSGLHQVCEPVDWTCDRRRGMSKQKESF